MDGGSGEMNCQSSESLQSRRSAAWMAEAENGVKIMSIYTKQGDSGRTSLINGTKIPKYDERIELNGMIDELNSHLGMVKVISDPKQKEIISSIQRNLMKVMSGVADPGNTAYAFPASETVSLENRINELEQSFPRVKDFVLYGGCELSARLDVARAVARRAERRFAKVAQLYGADREAMKYINRLSDYLYVQARYEDYNV